MASVWISWEGAKPVHYDFDTEAEINAFLKGIEAAADSNGMMSFEQFDDLEDYHERTASGLSTRNGDG